MDLSGNIALFSLVQGLGGLACWSVEQQSRVFTCPYVPPSCDRLGQNLDYEAAWIAYRLYRREVLGKYSVT